MLLLKIQNLNKKRSVKLSGTENYIKLINWKEKKQRKEKEWNKEKDRKEERKRKRGKLHLKPRTLIKIKTVKL